MKSKISPVKDGVLDKIEVFEDLQRRLYGPTPSLGRCRSSPGVVRYHVDYDSLRVIEDAEDRIEQWEDGFTSALRAG